MSITRHLWKYLWVVCLGRKSLYGVTPLVSFFSPMLFTRVVSTLVGWLCLNGIHVHADLDDVVLIQSFTGLDSPSISPSPLSIRFRTSYTSRHAIGWSWALCFSPTLGVGADQGWEVVQLRTQLLAMFARGCGDPG